MLYILVKVKILNSNEKAKFWLQSYLELRVFVIVWPKAIKILLEHDISLV